MMKWHSCMIGALILGLAGCSSSNPAGVMVTSVSSDGHYGITTDRQRRAILWNLQKHSYKILDSKANIYSAYFIKHTHDFMWQHNTNNEVTVQDVSGKVLKRFNPGFPSYGEVMTSDLSTYFATDQKWNLYKIANGHKQIIKKSRFDSGFVGAGKLMNLVLSPNDQYLLTAGVSGGNQPLSAGYQTHPGQSYSRSLLEGVVLWQVKTGKPVAKYNGLSAKSIATISPNGQHVVAGDESVHLYVSNLMATQKMKTVDLIFGTDLHRVGQQWVSNKKGLIKQPKDYGRMLSLLNTPAYKHSKYRASGGILAIKYIAKNDYLAIPEGSNWAILFKTTDPKPLKYFNLGIKPPPSLAGYDYNQSMDTAWQAHVLVTGQYKKPGIIFYHYNPKNKKLEKVWVGKINKRW